MSDALIRLWLQALLAAEQVNLDPDSGLLPGGPQLQRLVNGIAGFALIVLVGTAVGGAVWWAAGSASGNLHAVSSGKRMVLISLAAALVIGAAAALVNFSQGLGREVRVP